MKSISISYTRETTIYRITPNPTNLLLNNQETLPAIPSPLPESFSDPSNFNHKTPHETRCSTINQPWLINQTVISHPLRPCNSKREALLP